jgi:catechol 2,3-dioxygenase-like lactoylglutathione lyase family enzyme
MNACCRTCLCSCVPRPGASSEVIATPPPSGIERNARYDDPPFANASRSKGRLRHDDVRLQGRRLHRPLHDPLPPGAPDAAVLRFDLAPDADLRLLDSSMPATVASAGMFDHVGIAAADLAASERFYRTVLSALGAEPSHADAELVEWDDWAIGPTDREHPVTRGLHVGFRAPSREAVDAFWQAGIDAGYRDDGAPGPRTIYGPDYYGGFLLDPDGNSAEAVHTKREDPVPDGRVDHLWIRVRDPAASKRFYTTIAPHAGLRIGVDKPDHVQMVGENFSFSLIDDERPLTEHVHLAFPAQDDATVRAFHAAALAAGYEDHGGPGERAVYHPGYYGAFVLDPDGHNVEVVNHNR